MKNFLERVCLKILYPFITVFLLLAVGHVNPVIAQQAAASASLDTNAMLIGDHIGMTLKFSGPAAARVEWPFIPDTILGNILVIGRGKIDTAFSPDRKSVSLSQQLRLTCFDSGLYTIPQISFRFRPLPDTTAFSAASDLMMLSVHTVAVDTTLAIKPIAGPIKVPWTFREMLPWILAALGLILVAAMVTWYIIRRRRQKPILQFKPKVVLMPHETAFQELEKLRLKKLWQSGKVKEYYSELTEILRKYIEEQFHVPALEQTTYEIVTSLKTGLNTAPEVVGKLEQLLVMSDFVKFAKAQPVATENENALAGAVAFVQQTIQAGMSLNQKGIDNPTEVSI